MQPSLKFKGIIILNKYQSKLLNIRNKTIQHNMFKNNKKAQLGIIEFKFFFIGLIVGIILVTTLIYMANNNILIPFKIGFVCPIP